MNYDLADFDYDLPENLIAQKPAKPRDNARLLVYDREKKRITDDYFYNLLQYLPAKTSLVANNSKVEQCRLLFDEGRKEIFLLKIFNDTTAKAMIRPGKKFKAGQTVSLTSRISAEVLAVDDEGLRTLRFNLPLSDPRFDEYRHTPFPPYIEQNDALADQYQTVYARPIGSKAAPTAGLHFTKEMWRQIGASAMSRQEVTLHVGLGTFAPVKDSIESHKMHEEWYELDEPTASALNKAVHITAVGTTSMRVLEANRQSHPDFMAEQTSTDIFIKPGYSFKAVDALITNFHLPQSTLLMLVAAFMGYDEMFRVYEYAMEQRYRFYSFGDAMLIL